MTRDYEAKRKARDTRISGERANEEIFKLYEEERPRTSAELRVTTKGMKPGDVARVTRLNRAVHLAPPVSDPAVLLRLGRRVRAMSILTTDTTDENLAQRTQAMMDKIDLAMLNGELKPADHKQLQEDLALGQKSPSKMTPGFEQVEDRIHRVITGGAKGSLFASLEPPVAFALDMALSDYYDAMRQPGANANQWWEQNADRYQNSDTMETLDETTAVFIQGLGPEVAVQETDAGGKLNVWATWDNLQRPEIWERLTHRQKGRLERWMSRGVARRQERIRRDK